MLLLRLIAWIQRKLGWWHTTPYHSAGCLHKPSQTREFIEICDDCDHEHYDACRTCYEQDGPCSWNQDKPSYPESQEKHNET